MLQVCEDAACFPTRLNATLGTLLSRCLVACGSIFALVAVPCVFV